MTNFEQIFGQIIAPEVIRRFANGSAGIKEYLTVLIAIFFSSVAVIFLFMILFAGFQWLTSGGNKESLMKARSRITSAIIGVAIISLGFFITRVVASIFGISLY